MATHLLGVAYNAGPAVVIECEEDGMRWYEVCLAGDNIGSNSSFAEAKLIADEHANPNPFRDVPRMTAIEVSRGHLPINEWHGLIDLSVGGEYDRLFECVTEPGILAWLPSDPEDEANVDYFDTVAADAPVFAGLLKHAARAGANWLLVTTDGPTLDGLRSYAKGD